MTICRVKGCGLEIHEKENECILHCEKSKYVEITDAAFYKKFARELTSYIANLASEKLPSLGVDTGKINKETLQKALNPSPPKESYPTDIQQIFRAIIIVLENIKFPSTKNCPAENFNLILSKLSSIHFKKCTFWISDLGISENIKKLYEDCEFKCKWFLRNEETLNDSSPALYKNCNFLMDVSNNCGDAGIYVFTFSLFYNCKFHKKLEFLNASFDKQIFISDDTAIEKNKEIKSKLAQISFNKCIIKEKCLLNNYQIESFLTKDSEFKSKIEFKYNIVIDFKIDNTNFNGLVDTYETKFEKFKIEKSIFDNFVGFEKCEFGKKHDQNESYVVVFMYATFHGFVNFRNTVFHSGLNIENINLKEPPNFLNTKINPVNSNRETFRIVKHSFDAVGNLIEANKFFAEEMKKYKEEIKKSGRFDQKFILFFNNAFSNFGQSYLRPIGGLITLAIMQYFIQIGYEENLLYRKGMPINEFFSYLTNILNEITKFIIPFENKLLRPKMEFLTLMFYIFNSSLIWLTIVAIKRHTKR